MSAYFNGLVGAALMGLIGAAGMFLLEELYSRKQVVLAQNLAQLNMQVSSMKKDLEHLKELQSQHMNTKRNSHVARRPKHHRKASDGHTEDIVDAKVATHLSGAYLSDTNTEYNSPMGTDYDVSSEDFYDVSSDEDSGSRKGSLTNGTKTNSREVEILSTADTLLGNGSEEDVERAFLMLMDLRSELLGDNSELQAEVLWRIGRCCWARVNACEKNNDIEGKKKNVFEGIDYCKEAVENDCENAEAHKWYAILIGLRTDFVGTRDKIQDGVLFKDHVEEAMRLNPSDASLYHLIGRFKFELSNLSWLERKVAGTLFGEVPMANYDEALQEFERAESLTKKDWKENRLMLAKCCLGKGDYASGVDWLDKTVSLPSNTSDDHVVEREAQALLSKYSGYRRSE